MSVYIYCGNNLYELNKNNVKLGTRYECLRKGIGKGLSLPADPKYNSKYKPIIPNNIYCGDKLHSPGKNKRFGTPSSCLQRGVGIGKKLKAKRLYEKKKPKKKPKKKSKKKSKKKPKKKSKKKPKKK